MAIDNYSLLQLPSYTKSSYVKNIITIIIKINYGIDYSCYNQIVDSSNISLTVKLSNIHILIFLDYCF